jgi:hypothetical protein
MYLRNLDSDWQHGTDHGSSCGIRVSRWRGLLGLVSGPFEIVGASETVVLQPSLRWPQETAESHSRQPRSGGGSLSPGRKPRVKCEIETSRVAAALLRYSFFSLG